MKRYTWASSKNRINQAKGRPSFEAIVAALEGGGWRDTLPTHRPDLYPTQQRSIVEWRGEIYVVPFYESATEIVLITCYANRKLRGLYLQGEGGHAHEV
jgi:hypothetical protein